MFCMLPGARFGFELDEELKVAASCPEVQKALGSKVSRERVGHEVSSSCWIVTFFVQDSHLSAIGNTKVSWLKVDILSFL